MPVKHPYEQYVSGPPAPIIEVTLGWPGGSATGNEAKRKALVDSGSSRTCIPEKLANTLGLQVCGHVRVGGVTGTDVRPVYPTDVTIQGIGTFTVQAIGLDQDKPLLGRDIINQRRILLDGPAKTLTMS